MQTALLIFLSILPTVILLWYFEKQDKGKKEPSRLKWKIFGWGILIAVFAVIIELNIGDLYNYLGLTKNFWIYIFLNAFVTAALVEEALKFWVVKTRAYKSKYFDEIMDGITYTIIASLGFATLENVLYVLEGGITIAIVRAFVSVPAHAMFSGVMGYYIGKAKFAPAPWISRKLLWKGFGFGVLYHGLFNFLLFTESALILLLVPLLVIMGLHLKVKIKAARFADKVDKTAPKKLSFKRISKAFFAALLIVLGVAAIIGSIMLIQDPTSGYTEKDIIPSLIIAVALFVISYFLLRSAKPPQNSP